MGLAFSVGAPTEVFTEPFSFVLRDLLAEEFGDAFSLETKGEHYWSEELGWSGWRLLQNLARQHIPDRTPHLVSMEALQGAYLPVAVEPCTLEIEGNPTPLDIASLPSLVAELEALGNAVGLPTEDEGLRSLAAKYLDDDAIVDSDMDIQTYAHLLLAAHEATRRKQPLWVVK